MKCFASIAAAEIDAIAANCTANMGKSRTHATMFVVRQRLIIALPLFRQCVRNTMRQAAKLREQQGNNQQDSGEQGVTHGAHFNRCARTGQVSADHRLIAVMLM